MSIKGKITNIIASANAVTGKTDATLTEAVRSLIGGYGAGGLPDLLHDETMQVATTSTGQLVIKTIDVPQTFDTYIMLSRDVAGPRNGYYYGSVSIVTKAFGSPIHTSGTARCENNAVTGGTSSYGVYMAETMSGDNVRLTLYKRYNATYAPIVDGTYRVQIFGINLLS